MICQVAIRLGICVVASFAFVSAVDGQEPPAVVQVDYERASAAAALAMLEKQVEAAGRPQKLVEWLQTGRQHTEQLLGTTDAREARRLYRAAARAFARISRWLQENEQEAELPTLNERLERQRNRLTRLTEHLANITQRATARGVVLVPGSEALAIQQADEAITQRNLPSARARLAELVAALDALQAQLESAEDAVEAAP